MAKIFLAYESQKIQSQFRKWYGCLSVLELAVNSKLTRQIQEIENRLEALKLARENNAINKLNLTNLETDLIFLWELLTPTEKSRQLVFNKFLELQNEVRATCERNTKNKGN